MTKHVQQAIKKAQSSICRHKVAAVGIGHKGEFLFISRNYPRFEKFGGGVHAEMDLMHRYGTRIKTIIIFRVNKTGSLLPIHPCKRCSKIANKLGINIIPYGA